MECRLCTARVRRMIFVVTRALASLKKPHRLGISLSRLPARWLGPNFRFGNAVEDLIGCQQRRGFTVHVENGH